MTLILLAEATQQKLIVRPLVNLVLGPCHQVVEPEYGAQDSGVPSHASSLIGRKPKTMAVKVQTSSLIHDFIGYSPDVNLNIAHNDDEQNCQTSHWRAGVQFFSDD